MKRLSLCLALICLLVSGIGAVDNIASRDYVWRILSSNYHESWQDFMGPDGEVWESSHYYYSASEPLQLDSLVTLESAWHYQYTSNPVFSQKVSLIFHLPGYIPGSRTVETIRPDGLLLESETFATHSPDSPVSEKTEYTYDQQGNLLGEYYYSNYNGNLAPRYLTTYSYRSDNQLLRKARYRVINSFPDDLELDASENRVYNDNALEIERYFGYSFGYWGRISKSYNTDLLPVTETRYYSEDSLSWSPYEETRTSYALYNGVFKPHQISHYIYSDYNSSWVWSVTTTHSYSNDFMQEWISSSYPDPVATGMTTILYNSGMHVVSKHSHFSSEEYTSSSTLTNVWDLSSALDDPYLPKPDLKLSVYPNPFNPRTTIHYELKSPGKVVLDLYNIRGQRIKRLVNAIQEPGEQTVELLLNSSELGSGVYFLRLEAGGNTESTKILLLK